jgi:hypothetical protein
MKILIEVMYQRIPREHFRPGDTNTEPSVLHNGMFTMRSTESAAGMFKIPFKEKPLEYVAAWLHYAVRSASSLGYEFGVQVTKKPPRGGRPVVMGLSLSQVELIYRSEESAKGFFAPIVINRGETK